MTTRRKWNRRSIFGEFITAAIQNAAFTLLINSLLYDEYYHRTHANVIFL